MCVQDWLIILWNDRTVVVFFFSLWQDEDDGDEKTCRRILSRDDGDEEKDLKTYYDDYCYY